MSNVINNIIKNDTTYAVQDSRVDSLKNIFVAEYNATTFETVNTQYAAGDTLFCKYTDTYGVVRMLSLARVDNNLTAAQRIFWFSCMEDNDVSGSTAEPFCYLIKLAYTGWEYVGLLMQRKLTAGNNIQLNGQTISATDTTYTAGSNVQINNNVISATDTTYSEASTSSSGLMSASDKVKLNGVASGASAVSVSASGTATDTVSYITVNGVEKKLAGGSGSVEVDGSTIKANSQGKLAATCGASYIENPPIPGETFTKTLMRAPQEVIEQFPSIYDKAAVVGPFDGEIIWETVSASFGNITISTNDNSDIIVSANGTDYLYYNNHAEASGNHYIVIYLTPGVEGREILWDALATNQSATVKEVDTPVDPTVSYINNACINPESWQKILTPGNGITIDESNTINNSGVTALGEGTGNIMLADDVYFNDDNWFGTIYGGAKEVEQAFDEPMQTDIVGTFYEQEYDPETGYGPAKYNVTTALSATTINFLKSIQAEEKKVALNVYVNSGEYAGDCIGDKIVCTCSSDGFSEWFFEGFVDIDYADVPFELRLFSDNTAKLILDKPNIHDVPIYGDITSLKIDVIHTYEATEYTPIDANFVPLAAGLPTAPTTDGNYVLKCSIVSGVATYSWVAQA